MLEREEKKYFRSKIIDKDLYDQITQVMSPYLTDDKLIMLSHPWSTQKNESMKNLVAAYVPKTKNFSGIMYLQTRVDIAAGVLSSGYLGFWTRVFHKLGLGMDDKFAATIVAQDKKKERRGRFSRLLEVRQSGGRCTTKNSVKHPSNK